MEVVEDVAESGLESASIGQAASRLFVDEDPDLVVDAPWLVDLGQQTRRARPKSCLRRPPRAWRQRSKPWVLMALTGVKCDTVPRSRLTFDARRLLHSNLSALRRPLSRGGAYKFSLTLLLFLRPRTYIVCSDTSW